MESGKKKKAREREKDEERKVYEVEYFLPLKWTLFWGLNEKLVEFKAH